jgi:hypothetical protein
MLVPTANSMALKKISETTEALFWAGGSPGKNHLQARGDMWYFSKPALFNWGSVKLQSLSVAIAL